MTRSEILDYFKHVTFEEDNHVYFVNEKPLSKSVSDIVKTFVKEVDFEKIAGFIDKKKKLKQGTTKLCWEEKANKACELGTKVHLFGERYATNRDLLPENGYEVAIQRYYDVLEEKYEIAFLELVMFHKRFLFGGTADIILRNKETGKYVIGDIKTNAKLFENYKGKKLLSPFTSLLETNFNKYQIQLNIYQILFEQSGAEVESRFILWVRDDGTYMYLEVDNLTDKLKKVLK